MSTEVKRLLAIDPAPTKSGIVGLQIERCQHGAAPKVLFAAIVDNLTWQFITVPQRKWWNDYQLSRFFEYDHLAIEMVRNYGKIAGDSLFETAKWVGCFEQAWRPRPFTELYRPAIKLALCQTARCGDPQVRSAIIDRYPKTGGGKTPAVGTKKQPGPLYGIHDDLWAALAVGIAWCEQE